MKYFVKAFFAEGMEQMLWHITVLEALMGEKGEGVTEKLARRISIILGKSNQERKKLKKDFKDLYNLRSELVHGKYFDHGIKGKYFLFARELARRSLLWFINYLYKVQKDIIEVEGEEKIPTREDILSILDMEKSERVRIHKLLGMLPPEFPGL